MWPCCCSRSHFADKDLSRRWNHDHAVAVAIAMREEKADRLIFQSHALTEQLFHTWSETVCMCVYMSFCLCGHILAKSKLRGLLNMFSQLASCYEWWDPLCQHHIFGYFKWNLSFIIVCILCFLCALPTGLRWLRLSCWFCVYFTDLLPI